MKTCTYQIPYERERRYFYIMISLFVVSIFIYMYFLSASVVHVVMRKEIDTQISETSSLVSKLESEYIEAQHAMSEELATMQGYVEVRDKIYIDRTTPSVAMSRN